jgi:hypothetical protein
VPDTGADRKRTIEPSWLIEGREFVEVDTPNEATVVEGVQPETPRQVL